MMKRKLPPATLEDHVFFWAIVAGIGIAIALGFTPRAVLTWAGQL